MTFYCPTELKTQKAERDERKFLFAEDKFRESRSNRNNRKCYVCLDVCFVHPPDYI